ncbi:MAG: hypothetical protein MUF69_08870 [Desulfobacterota bacterium]|jgi:hypothetical protein|nr:hypothetical protein [Thermodesulfobacteriota bacterium]
MFIVKCSWCNREISRVPGKDGVSHGICPPCYEKTMLEVKSYLPRQINLLKRTVLLKNTLAEQY